MRGRTVGTVLAVAALTAVSACTNHPPDPRNPAPEAPGRRITVWTGANEPHQVAGTKRIIAEFTATTDIEVELVPLTVQHMYERAGQITDPQRQANPGSTTGAEPTTAPSRDTHATRAPDVIGGLPLTTAHALAAIGFLDPDAAGDVLDELGRKTFQEGVLDLTVRDDETIVVPSDAWTQLLVFRKDLFADAGLPVPDTYAKLRRAAEKLAEDGKAGIVVGNAPGDPATARTFTYLALANGCRLVDETGRVALDSPECVEAFEFYAALAGLAEPGSTTSGDKEKAQETVTTADVRAAYLAGDAAIVPASSAFLDELGGLDPGERPRCEQCESDPAFLAKNSSVVTALRGSPDGPGPIQYGGIDTWAVTTGADTEAATRFVTYMMDEGYLQWLGLEAGGSLPLRRGAADDAERFIQAWATLPTGVQSSASLSSLYPSTVLDLLRSSPANFTSWGIARNRGGLAGDVRGDLILSEAVNDLLRDGASPQQAANRAQRRVGSLWGHRPAATPAPTAPDSP